jgi:glycosyltransferase involved in cell wall biosynthesis
MGNLEIRGLLFLGSAQKREACRDNPICSEAANNYQLNLIEALGQHGVEQTLAFTLLPRASFPRGPVLVAGQRSRVDERLTLWRMPFVNLGLFKLLTAFVAFVGVTLITRVRRRWQPDAVLIYNPVLRYALSGLLAARLWGVPAVLIVADLNPATPWKLDRSLMEQIRTRLRIQALRRFDGLIVLSGHVADDYAPNKPTLKVEGGVTWAQADTLPLTSTDGRRTLLYSGNLNELSGAKLALDAFELLDGREYQLWFTGRGPLQDQIQEAASKDPRIRYFGFVNRATYFSLVARATVLLNPRLDLLENRYNFPSKLLEYLASGRPVITTACSDLEEEYGGLVFMLRNETPEGLARLIQDVCSRDSAELDAIGQRAREYVLQHITWDVQSQRVYDFLCQLAASQRGGKGVTA